MTPARPSLRVPRARRLKRRRLIRPLFERGHGNVSRLRVGPMHLVWRVVPRTAVGADTTLQVGFAPGRRRTAVARNRIRRVMRETFRQHAAPLVARLDGHPDTLTLFVLYRGRDDTAARDIPRTLPDAIARLARRDFPAADGNLDSNPAPPAP